MLQLQHIPPPQSTTPGLYFVSIHQMAPPVRGSKHLITAYYSVVLLLSTTKTSQTDKVLVVIVLLLYLWRFCARHVLESGTRGYLSTRAALIVIYLHKALSVVLFFYIHQ